MGRPKGSTNKPKNKPKESKKKHEEKHEEKHICKLCDSQILNEISIKIGELGPICRGCYCLLSIHFDGLEIKEVDSPSSASEYEECQEE